MRRAWVLEVVLDFRPSYSLVKMDQGVIQASLLIGWVLLAQTLSGVLDLGPVIKSALNGRGPDGQSSKLLEPLADAMFTLVKPSFADDAPIKMQVKKKCATAHLDLCP